MVQNLRWQATVDLQAVGGGQSDRIPLGTAYRLLLTVGELEDVRSQLPPDFDRLFKAGSEGAMPRQ